MVQGILAHRVDILDQAFYLAHALMVRLFSLSKVASSPSLEHSTRPLQCS